MYSYSKFLNANLSNYTFKSRIIYNIHGDSEHIYETRLFEPDVLIQADMVHIAK